MSELNKRINAIQNELKVPKNQYNSFGKYKYRSAEDILEGLKPLLQKYEVTQTISDEVKLIGDRYYLIATVTVEHLDEKKQVQGLARESLTKKGMDDSQITGTASSYARKYALNGLWAIDDTKDADTDEYHSQANKPQNQPNKAVTISEEERKELMNNAIALHGDYAQQAIMNLLENLNIKKTNAIKKEDYEKAQQFISDWQP